VPASAHHQRRPSPWLDAASSTGLVDDFVATVGELGGTVDPAVVAAELQTRIDAIATQLHVTTQTVLRTYIDDDWGRQMATTMMADVKERAAVPAGPPEHFALRVAGRLLAALGQAMLYAATNHDQQQPIPQLDLRQAAEAVTGLGLAIHDSPPGEQLVTVSAEIVAWTRATLEVFRDQLRAGAWSSCPCGEQHAQPDTDTAVLTAVGRDLLYLPAVRAAEHAH
jgi:hypothetical protein